MSVWVHRQVFSPYLTISTKLFVDYLQTLSLEKKRVLELGCGSGLMAVFAAKQGALVTATDINPVALKYLKKSAEKNGVAISILYSDLFEELKGQVFDFILINPPYYPKQPTNMRERAWFCGENFEYYQALFSQMPDFLSPQTTCLMILSEDCKIDHIKELAGNNSLAMQLVSTQKSMKEVNYIFRISQ